MTSLALFFTVFIACAVEAIEAVTIVLAAATGRESKSAAQGTGAALALLAAIILALGPTLLALPINALRLFVGTLLLLFGLQWLRKAILRASGRKALHDEIEVFNRELAEAKSAVQTSKFSISDWYAFTLAFKGVFLEGLEVVFIVLTFGVIHHAVGIATFAAMCAVLLVSAIGFVVRKPLARAPENSMKFSVGIALTTFGIFWSVEGAGRSWPLGDATLLVIALGLIAVSAGLIAIMRRAPLSVSASPSAVPRQKAIDQEKNRFIGSVISFGRFWYDFIVGDDLIGAAIILLSVIATHFLGWVALATGALVTLLITLLVRKN